MGKCRDSEETGRIVMNFDRNLGMFREKVKIKEIRSPVGNEGKEKRLVRNSYGKTMGGMGACNVGKFIGKGKEDICVG